MDSFTLHQPKTGEYIGRGQGLSLSISSVPCSWPQNDGFLFPSYRTKSQRFNFKVCEFGKLLNLFFSFTSSSKNDNDFKYLIRPWNNSVNSYKQIIRKYGTSQAVSYISTNRATVLFLLEQAIRTSRVQSYLLVNSWPSGPSRHSLFCQNSLHLCDWLLRLPENAQAFGLPIILHTLISFQCFHKLPPAKYIEFLFTIQGHFHEIEC